MQAATHKSYNAFHLGDNMVHLHWLRAMALKYPDHRFMHALHECNLAPMLPLTFGVPNLELCIMEEGHQPDSEWRNVWKNAGGFWQNHPLKTAFVAFYLEWFCHLADEMGLASAFSRADDMLFNYPSLLKPWYSTLAEGWPNTERKPHPAKWEFDVLVVNSQPSSGQFRAMREDNGGVFYLDPMIAELEKRYRVVTTNPTQVPNVACTRDWDLTLTQIGNLSLRIPYHVMISTGPSWPTFNVWNALTAKYRLLLIDCGESLEGMAPNLEHAASREDALEKLRAKGIL